MVSPRRLRRTGRFGASSEKLRTAIEQLEPILGDLEEQIDGRMNAFLSRPIEGGWPYLWINATYVKAREAGRIVSTATIIAVGVNTDGRREVLGVATGPSEAETFWKGFLRPLADRGLRGVKLVIADDHKGLRAAASKVFHATLQRCRVRWMRNALAHVAAKQRPAVIAMIKTIFAQGTAQDAHAQWKSVADALCERAPKLAELMDEAREDVLTYTAFPRSPSLKSPAPIRSSASTAKSNAAPMSAASFPMIVPLFDWSVR